MRGWRDKPVILEKTCPECGKHLVCRDGKHGEFFGCLGYPACHYTERGGDVERIYQPPSPYCEKCNHTGLIPFKNKESKVIPYVWYHCDCHQDEPERYQSTRVGDFDFPMSQTFRAFSYEYCGQPDPDTVRLPEPEEEAKPVFQPRPIINITYKVNDVDTPAFKALGERITLISGRLTKYFEGKNKPQPLKQIERGKPKYRNGVS